MPLGLRLLHRGWQRLPPAWRRRAYEVTTHAAAQRARASADVPPCPIPPFVVAGALSAPTGLGEAARATLRGLTAAGLPVSAVDLSGALMQRSVVPLPALPAPEPGPGTLLLFAQPPNVGHALALLGRRLLRGKRRVGCWVWDLEVVPQPWVMAQAYVHEVATPSLFCVEALRSGLDVPVRRLAYPLAAAPPPPRPPRPDRPCTFGLAFDLGSTAARKNPLAAVEAFRRAFGPGDPARLVVKVRDIDADPVTGAALRSLVAAPGAEVRLLTGDLDAVALEAWWAEVDVLVSLHRSEGFGLVPAEAMQRGIPVIATDWSATTELVTPETGWPVPASLVPALDATGRYELAGARWAEADLDAAARAMREAADPAEAAQRGGRAMAHMAERYSTERFLAELGLRDHP